VKRYKVLLLVRLEKEILADNDATAHTEALRLAARDDAVLSTIEFVCDEPESVDLEFEP